MTTPFVSLRSRSTWYFALVLAIYLFTGCNNFWTPCTEEGVVCTTFTDGGGTEDGKPDPPPDPNKPIGPSRKFEWRAKVQVDPNKFKYVGMKGTTPVFLANEDKSVTPNLPLRWVAYQLDLLTEKEDQRSTLDMNRTGFPAAPSHDFLKMPILVSGVTFYKLSSDAKTIKDIASTQEILAGVRLPDSSPYVYFRHPELDVFTVSVKPTVMSAQSGTLIRWNTGETTFLQTGNAPATALVMGDLDATDQTSNGSEVIWFEGNRIQEIWHQGTSSGAVDPHLKVWLQDAIGRAAPGITAPILAGFVTDLNADKFVDFVYVRSGSVYVTSYKGRKADKPFEDWPDAGLPAVMGEIVKSIQAIDLTNDAFPDLVVETDKYVRFYLSIP